MSASMTSRERLLAAIRCEEVDHVPMHIIFWESRGRRHPMAPWSDERGRLEKTRNWGWDDYVRVHTQVTPGPAVQSELRYETQGDDQVVRQIWRTPAATVEEILKITEDWPEADDDRSYLPFLDDFQIGRAHV